MKNPFFFKRHAMGDIICLRVFEDEERSWSDNNARCITQVKTYARQRKISKSHASSWSSQVPRALREGESGAGPRTVAGGCAGGARRGSGRRCRRLWWKDVEVVHGGFGGKGRPRALGSGERGGARRVDGDDGAPWRDLDLGVLGCSSSALIRSVTILMGGERMGGRRRSRRTAEMDGIAVRVATRTVVGTGGRAVVDLGGDGQVGRREDGDDHHNRRRPPVVAVIAAGAKVARVLRRAGPPPDRRRRGVVRGDRRRQWTGVGGGG